MIPREKTSQTKPDQAKLEPNTKIADCFKLSWQSLTYTKILYNPAVASENQSSEPLESLVLHCDVETLDPSLVVGTCPEPVITELVDGKGRKIDPNGVQLCSDRPFYEALRRGTTPMLPPQLARSLPKRMSDSVMPSKLEIHFDPRSRKQLNGEIGQLKGYYYVLMAESFEHTVLQAEPNDDWVRLTPNLEVQVRDAGFAPSGAFLFDIQRRTQGKTPSRLYVNDTLPSRVLVAQQLIGPTGHTFPELSLPAHAGGTGGGSPIDKIHYVVAVNPTQHKIPFELEHISVPAFTGQTRSRTPNQDQMLAAPDSKLPLNMAAEKKTKEDVKTPQQLKLQTDPKVAKCFKPDWHCVTYEKTVCNPAIPTKSQNKQASESLTLTCLVEISDPKLVLGTCDKPIITQIVDGKGRNTEPDRVQLDPDRMYYQAPHYRPKVVFPSTLARLEGNLRLTLGLPLASRSMPKHVTELAPVRLQIPLDIGLIEAGCASITRFRGYFPALMAESLEQVFVPFEPNDNWVRVTPDVEIRVVEAARTGSASHFSIEQRPQTTASRQLSVQDYLPSEIVIDRQFVNQNGKSGDRFGNRHRLLPCPAGGAGGVGGLDPVERIDYLIAVNPTHHKIAFELKDIPLPNP
jgi:hypothetical protein